MCSWLGSWSFAHVFGDRQASTQLDEVSKRFSIILVSETFPLGPSDPAVSHHLFLKVALDPSVIASPPFRLCNGVEYIAREVVT